jgi:predicted membrane-bound spermidine synthase
VSYELILTRIFSVTVWYHFAFLAVSLGMFGMTVGALIVDLFPRVFTTERAPVQISLAMTGFSVSAILALLFHLSVPILLQRGFLLSAVGAFDVIGNCISLAIPFTFSGIAICLTLTWFPDSVSKLYACDLLGAAIACAFIVYEVNHVSGPSTLLVSALIGAFSALCFSISGISEQFRASKILALVAVMIIGGLSAANILIERNGYPAPFRLVWIKGALAPKTLYERWNSFSFVRVMGDPQHPNLPQGWGINPRFFIPPYAGQLYLDIDGNAGTYISRFDGDTVPVRYLKCDVTNIVHHLRSAANVLVIGIGGGRDILSALVFKQKSVTGVELNPSIFVALNDVLGDFSGHLDKRPGVRMVNREARSYISSIHDQFDIIQISLIDTWAATASGAFALAENSIYTEEAWRIFIDHLTGNGILSVSRWYDSANPAEVYRLTALASAALRSEGVTDPRKHLLLIRYRSPAHLTGLQALGIGTILLCKSPFQPADLDQVKRAATAFGFDIMLSPEGAADRHLAELCDQPFNSAMQSRYPFRIDPPTDDSPYFFQLMKASTVGTILLNPSTWALVEQESNTLQGFFVVLALSLLLLGLLIFCVFLPLRAHGPQFKLDRKSRWLMVYFVSIGCGFMFIEISQMQRLAVYLGHPTYGLSVVLFTLLIFSGLGSLVSQTKLVRGLFRTPPIALSVITAVVWVTGLVSPPLLHASEGSSLATHIAVCASLLAVVGFFVGMALPTGLTIASRDRPEMTAWLWALNGAASVLGSVLAVLSSMTVGIGFTHNGAAVLYLLATCAIFMCKEKAN